MICASVQIRLSDNESDLCAPSACQQCYGLYAPMLCQDSRIFSLGGYCMRKKMRKNEYIAIYRFAD